MRNVYTIIDELAAGLAELKAALQPLAVFAGGSSAQTGPRPRRAGSSRARGRRRAATTPRSAAASPNLGKPASAKTKKAASPKIRAQRIQQGKYLGALRNLTAPQRAQVKMAKAHGDYGSALKLAASFQKKSA